MPHFIIECPENLLENNQAETLMQTVYSTALSTGLFASAGPGGIKVRINTYKHYLTVGEPDPFIHIFAYVMEGRTTAQKSELSKQVITALSEMFPEIAVISMNITDFEKATYCNKGMVI